MLLWQVDNIRKSILTHSYLLTEIWEQREAPHVPIPIHRVVHKNFGIHTMSIICAIPFDNNQFVFDVLFADETSQKYALSVLISLSNSGENGKVRFAMHHA